MSQMMVLPSTAPEKSEVPEGDHARS